MSSRVHYAGKAVTFADINGEFKHKASEACNEGDLLWWDDTNHCVRPASKFTDAGDGTTQTNFALKFVGVGMSTQLAADAVGRDATVYVDHIWYFPCVSDVFAPGSLVEPKYTTDHLEDQILVKTATLARAIGVVLKEYATATTLIKVRLFSQLLNAPPLIVASTTTTTTTTTTTSTTTTTTP